MFSRALQLRAIVPLVYRKWLEKKSDWLVLTENDVDGKALSLFNGSIGLHRSLIFILLQRGKVFFSDPNGFTQPCTHQAVRK